MLGILLGFGLGAMAFTKTGQETGNKIADMAVNTVKKVMGNAKANESAEQSTRTTGDTGNNS